MSFAFIAVFLSFEFHDSISYARSISHSGFKQVADVYNMIHQGVHAERIKGYAGLHAQASDTDQAQRTFTRHNEILTLDCNRKRLEDGLSDLDLTQKSNAQNLNQTSLCWSAWILWKLLKYFAHEGMLDSTDFKLDTTIHIEKVREIEHSKMPKWRGHRCGTKGCAYLYQIDGNEKVKRLMCGSPESAILFQDKDKGTILLLKFEALPTNPLLIS